MPASRFCRYELRTTDPNAARAFYASVFGAQFWGDDVSLAPLPERAIARGAPAHWLGHLGVGDVEETVERAVALGAQPLGPIERSGEGASRAVLRDPFGAVMAVSSETATPLRASVARHLLHVQDEERALAFYGALFGWSAKELLDLGPAIGRQRVFAWDESGRSAGSIANTARLPHVHPHWMFHFPVMDMTDALGRVRALGGKPMEPIQTPNGDLVAACDDPQGAAFALVRRAVVP